jgi:S-phase kinase-associated protein 1
MHEIEKEIAIECALIKDMVEDSIEEEIPLDKVSSEILKKVLEFIVHHKTVEELPEIERPLKSNDLKDSVPAWYATYIESEDLEYIFDVIAAANYLNCKPLLELGCAKVGSKMKGKGIPEIRKLFNIENDFTPEEERAVMEGRANIWDDNEEENAGVENPPASEKAGE